MIKINRGKPPLNSSLDAKKGKVLKKIETLVNKGQLKSKNFCPLWVKEKEFLHKSQYGKCCYCERRRDQSRESDVEHFRPKSQVEGIPEHKGYWWLAYEWENLLIACKNCNESYKKAHFPLEDESKRAYNRDDSIQKEQPLLINPLEENPSQFIEYDLPEKDKPIMIKAIGRCRRGEKTIELTGINSKEVMEERAAHFSNLNDYRLALDLIKMNGIDISKMTKKWVKEDSSKHAPFSGFTKFYFKKMRILR